MNPHLPTAVTPPVLTRSVLPPRERVTLEELELAMARRREAARAQRRDAWLALLLFSLGASWLALRLVEALS